MKRWLNSLSIRYKLTLLMTAVCLITLSVATTIFSIMQIVSLKESAVANTTTKAALIATGVESAILFYDERAAKSILQRLENDMAIEAAAVILENGKILADYRKFHGVDLTIPDLSRPAHISSKYLDVIYQISVQNETIGYVYLQSNLEKLNAQLVNYALALIAVLLVSIAIAYLLSVSFQGLFTKPIKSMVQCIDKICQTSNYNKRLRHQGNDELGQLALGFNHLLAAVQDRESELQHHGEQLQQLVDKRTQQLHYKAHYDALTDLPNRHLLLDRLNQAIGSANRERQKLALLYLDLDRFKIINDSLGHSVGDQLLKTVAGLLQSIKREGDTVARLGGDEFVFLLQHIAPEDAARVAERIIQLFAAPLHLEDHVLHVSTSIGISIYPDDGGDDQALLKNADVSMYHAKKERPGRYCFYRNEMNNASFKRLSLENKLRNAFSGNEFYLVYQPQVCLKSGSVRRAEALIRWSNPSLGEMSPAEFIPVAEEIGLINQIGDWVIASVCKQLSEWGKSGIQNIVISVNISASHLMDESLIQCIRKNIAFYRLNYRQLEIEITEDVFLNHSQHIIETLDKIRALGVEIAIDDFGTGYSSLRYLQQFPVNTLKLDGMFIADVDCNSSSQGIVSSSILLAHSLGLTMVSECVETEAQLDFLRKAGCDLVQGYYLYRPQSADGFAKIIKQTSMRSTEKKALQSR